jgi:importin subunit beta-1
LASLQTLGFICEELTTKDIDKEKRQVIVSALLSGIENSWEDKDIVVISIKALYHALEYTEEIFKEEGQGNIIMDLIYKCTNHDDDMVKQVAMQCIVEVVRYHYNMIEPFMG